MARRQYYSFNRRLRFWCGSSTADAGGFYNGTGGFEPDNLTGWSTDKVPTMISRQILTNINVLKEDYDIRYWYGAEGNIPTRSLAASLRADYYTGDYTWSQEYYNIALQDVDDYDDEYEEEGYSNIRVGDCSWFVGYAYGMNGFNARAFSTITIPRIFTQTLALKDGYILWRSGHCGIYWEGKQIHLSGLLYDLVEETYNPEKWSAFFMSPNVIYNYSSDR